MQGRCTAARHHPNRECNGRRAASSSQCARRREGRSLLSARPWKRGAARRSVSARRKPTTRSATARGSGPQRRPRVRAGCRPRGFPRASPRGTGRGLPVRAGPAPPGPFAGSARESGCPHLSMTLPMRPSSASTSRTRWPLPMPPIDGLHDISPIVSCRCVTRHVDAPARAAAAAASQPAWPPPMTMTSKESGSAEQVGIDARGGGGSGCSSERSEPAKKVAGRMMSSTRFPRGGRCRR